MRIVLVCEYLVSSWSNHLERFIRHFFCWKKYVTGVIFEVSKDLHHFQCLCSLDSLILLFFFRYLCFLSKERLKGVDPDGRRSREELRRIGEKETILYENKIYIQ